MPVTGDWRAWRRLLAALLAAVLGFPAAAGALGEKPPDAAVVTVAELPPEARLAIERIRRGGPFPYERDGIVFGNFEKRLPPRERGYYREYTVRTPGARDRGARRIVAGRGGELYYTDDHYRTFRRVADPGAVSTK